MTRRVAWRLTTLALVVQMGVLAGLEARGNAPVIVREAVNDTFTTGFCGFPMEVETTGTGIFHEFYDDDGNLERVIVTSAAIRLTFTNLLTGESVWTPSVNMVLVEIDEVVQSLRGLLWRLVIPGEGLVTADVGRIDFQFVLDENGEVVSEEIVFSAGQQENAFIAAVCDALQ